jgi:N-acetylglucosamine kinase-like BadF-type ATPase
MGGTVNMARVRHGLALVVGVDAGGTWVRVRARAGERRVLSLARPASAVPDLGIFLQAVWRRRGFTARDVAALVVGSRGVWLPRERRRLRRRLARLARRVTVMSDVEAAWHATLDDERGVLLLAGTGSIVLGRDARGRWARAGGLGPLLGDDGSAFWIGREWLRAHGDPVARRYAVRRDAVSAIAGLARRVVVAARDGDPVARRIVRGAQARLAAQAVTVVRALRLPAPVSIGGAGSVMGDAWFAAGVRRALARAGLHARWRAAGETPVEAALRLAAASVARPR